MISFALILIVVILLALGIAFVATTGVLSRANKKGQTPLSADGLSVDSIALFKPVQRIAREIEEVVTSDGSLAAVRGMAQAEVRRIEEQVLKALNNRDHLRSSVRDQGSAEADLERLEKLLQGELSESERSSYESALAARKTELHHYQKARRAMASIEDSVREAQAALSELKAKLTAAKLEPATGAADTDLRETLGQLQSFSVTVDEVKNLL